MLRVRVDPKPIDSVLRKSGRVRLITGIRLSVAGDRHQEQRDKKQASKHLGLGCLIRVPEDFHTYHRVFRDPVVTIEYVLVRTKSSSASETNNVRWGTQKATLHCLNLSLSLA